MEIEWLAMAKIHKWINTSNAIYLVLCTFGFGLAPRFQDTIAILSRSAFLSLADAPDKGEGMPEKN